VKLAMFHKVRRVAVAGVYHLGLAISLSTIAACGGRATDQSPSRDAAAGTGGGAWGAVDPDTLRFSKVVAGRDHFCGITLDDGRLVCVADDEIQSEESGPFVALDMNDDVDVWSYRCAVKSTGELVCSGTPTVAVPTGRFVDVSVGAFNACARTESGAVECWIPEVLGGLSSPPLAGPAFSVNQWSFCTQRSTLDSSCIDREGNELLPTDGSGHFQGGLFYLVQAAPLARCAAIIVATPADGYGEFEEILNKDNIACFSAAGGRSKIDGRFAAFDVDVNEDGCAIGDAAGGGSIACWGAFKGSEPEDLSGPFTQVSVSSGLACVLSVSGEASCFRPAR
jgi:hypothetical protein